MKQLNETHDAELRSWVASANDHADFPIQNLPFAIFRRRDSNELFRGGVAIGDQVLDLRMLAESGLLSSDAQRAASAGAQSSLNTLMALDPAINSALRLALSRLLRTGAERQESVSNMLIPQSQVEFTLPCTIGDYTDFYTSIYHATAVGKLFRPDNPLLPNYQWIPIGYHGRSSSIAVSGQCFQRPVGQTKAADANQPNFGPCRRLDYEVEMGLFVGQATEPGEPIAMAQAEEHLFGFCLLNDWSARDIQAWEYQPLGPFLAKNFASTISPWIVTLEALAPFRATFARPDNASKTLDYLSSADNNEHGAFDIDISCFLLTNTMQQTGQPAARVSQSNFKHSWWTAAQMLTHHASNGCPMRPGDLLGSGTQSGPVPEEAGSLLELTQGGRKAITLPNGEERVFLQDGDTVVMRAGCQKAGARSIGFGEVQGTVLPAKPRDTNKQSTVNGSQPDSV